MSIKSGFFNSESPGGIPDRAYSAEDLASIFNLLYSTGIIAAYLQELRVIQSTTADMNVRVYPGAMMAHGYWLINSAMFTVAINAADSTLNRKDAIVAQFDIATSRIANIIYRAGAPASTPVEPALVNTSSVFELCLAYITVNAGVAAVTTAMIYDTRTDITLCGYARAIADAFLDAKFNSYFATNGKIFPERLTSKLIDVAVDRTFGLADAGTVQRYTSATARTLTIPLNSIVAFPIGTEIEVYQKGTGLVTISKSAGVVFEARNKTNPVTILSAGLFSWIGLKKTDADTWTVRGDVQ